MAGTVKRRRLHDKQPQAAFAVADNIMRRQVAKFSCKELLALLGWASMVRSKSRRQHYMHIRCLGPESDSCPFQARVGYTSER